MRAHKTDPGGMIASVALQVIRASRYAVLLLTLLIALIAHDALAGTEATPAPRNGWVSSATNVGPGRSEEARDVAAGRAPVEVAFKEHHERRAKARRLRQERRALKRNRAAPDADHGGRHTQETCTGASVSRLFEDFEGWSDSDVTYRHSPIGLSFEIISGNVTNATGSHWEHESASLRLQSPKNDVQTNFGIVSEGHRELVNFELNFIAGQKYTTGGIVLHFKDTGNYYFVNLRSGELERVADRVTTVIQGAGGDIRMPWRGGDRAYTVTSSVERGVVNIAVEQHGRTPRTFVDDSPHVVAGAIGFIEQGLKFGNYFLFDDIEILVSDEQPICLEPVPAPVATLKASADRVVRGLETILTWTSNAARCEGWGFDAGGAPSGSIIIAPTETTRYGITCTGYGDIASATTEIDVLPSTGCPLGSTDALSQYGITWTFADCHEYGRFANGDYWVIGPILLDRITPDFTGTENGWELNPDSPGKQGFDHRIRSFDPERVPPLPHPVEPGTSIVKSVSRTDCDKRCRPALQTAAILTVLDRAPPDRGATVFRPPYAGDEKPLFSTRAINTELLPKLDKTLIDPASIPSIHALAADFQRPWLDHKSGWTGRHLHPMDNMPDYGASIAVKTNEATLRLMLNDPSDALQPLLVNYLQYGIDLAGGVSIGSTFRANGGHTHGRLLPLLFAATLLESKWIVNWIQNHGVAHFSETQSVTTNHNGSALWGQGHTSNEYNYWFNQVTGRGSRTIADPYGYIDGGQLPGAMYQACCTSQGFKGVALALRLMPTLQDVWDPSNLLTYVNRWVKFGAWTQPDPCAPHDGNLENYGITFGPNGDGGCLLDNDQSDGLGRYPDMHGVNADGGYYRSRIVDRLWEVFSSTE